MPRAIVECIPNFSEARRPEVVEALMQSVTSVQDVFLLDHHSDMDHNRTVLTFAGTPKGVMEAAFRSIARAAELINLDQHSGEHPRIGAADVVPFVPISGISMQECVEMARQVGKRVGGELGIPVYLYEEAATRPKRRNLENIRRGQYEALKVEIGTNAERTPDFGPARVGTAGAVVIGARHPLIAFNVYLATEDVSIARKIARAIRQSSGGLRYVKALGLLVEGRAQVSMNLTNFRETPIGRVVEMICREAARYGVMVHHSELVGLIPQEALVDAAVWHLQLDQFSPDQILERRLEAALQSAAGPILLNFLDELASASPAPGGGSASAYSGAVAAALTAMVARLTVGKKKYSEVETSMRNIIERAEALRTIFSTAVEQDAATFMELMAAYQLPRETNAEQVTRSQAIEQASLKAAEVPMSVARHSLEILELAVKVVESGNLNAISDGAVAATQAQAALTGAGYNVRINLKDLKDRAAAERLQKELSALEVQVPALQQRVREAIEQRGGMPPS